MQKAVISVNYIQLFTLQVLIGRNLIEIDIYHTKLFFWDTLFQSLLQIILVFAFGYISSCDYVKHIQFDELLSHKSSETTSSWAEL